MARREPHKQSQPYCRRYGPILLYLAILLTGCTPLRVRRAWAGTGEVPMICCGSPGSSIEHSDYPSYTDASMEYVQLVNLPGGCSSFTPATEKGRIARSVEKALGKWAECPNKCQQRFAVDVARQLVTLRSAVIKAGPPADWFSPGSVSHGAPCFAGLSQEEALP